MSNFTVALIEEAVGCATEPLVCNQIEMHPFLDQSKVIAACRQHGMAVVAYSPIARGGAKNDAVLARIGKAHGKTAAQVCLRFLVQQGIVVIPRTSRIERLAENLAIFDFALSRRRDGRDRRLAQPRRPRRRLRLFRIAEMGLSAGTRARPADARLRGTAGRPPGMAVGTVDPVRSAGELAAMISASLPSVRRAADSGAQDRLPASARISGRCQQVAITSSCTRPKVRPGSANSLAHGAGEKSDQARRDVWVETDGTRLLVDRRDRDPDPRRRRQPQRQQIYRQFQDLSHRDQDQFARRRVRRQLPDVAKPATPEQAQAWLILVRFLQERYDIPSENIYAHNWIDHKDHRYCEGCDGDACAQARLPAGSNRREGLAHVPEKWEPVSEKDMRRRRR